MKKLRLFVLTLTCLLTTCAVLDNTNIGFRIEVGDGKSIIVSPNDKGGKDITLEGGVDERKESN